MGNIPHFRVRVWCSRLLLNFPHFNQPSSQQMCISASLQNKAILLHHPRKSTVLHLLAEAVCTCTVCTQTHRYTCVHRILLRACAMVRDAFVKQTHTNSCPHGASILWQELLYFILWRPDSPMKSLLKCYFLPDLPGEMDGSHDMV